MATDVAVGFPQVELQPLSTITVTVDDPSAVITSLNVHGWQEPAEDTPAPTVANPTGAYLPA